MASLPHLLTLPFSSRAIRALAISALTVYLAAAGGYAQDAQLRPDAEVPDVLVLVLSGMGPYDQVSVNYSSEVPEDTATADVLRLVELTGWPVQEAEVRTERPDVPRGRPSTSISFQVPSIANFREGRLPVAPFINVLKRFESIQINYILASEFALQGPKDFENRYVRIKMSRTGSSYLYRVEIKNRNFQQLDIPLESTEEKTWTAQSPVGSRLLYAAILIVVGAIVLYLAGFILLRWRRAQQ